ncbi:hypothetical protein BH18ACT5_BH18ACT5_17390 [soil metagenome]
MARIRLLVLLIVALLAIPGWAQAGGWALTSFDEMPTSFEAGETYELSYTILQHGQTPIDAGSSSVFVTDAAGNTTEFRATKGNDIGRYTVQVTFPESGTFTWQVSQGGFEPHDLGFIGVSEAAASPTASVGGFLLPAAFALVIAFLGVQIFALVRKRPRPVRAD